MLEQLGVLHEKSESVFKNAGRLEARRAYDSSVAEMVRGVEGAMRGTLSPASVARVRKLFTKEPELLGAMEEALKSSSTATLQQGVRSVGRVLQGVRGQRSILNNVGTIEKIADARLKHVQAERGVSAVSLASRVQANALGSMRQALADGLTPQQFLDSLHAKMREEWWMVERTLRTENAYAYCRAQADAVATVVRAEPELRGKLFQRWTEKVSDVTGAPLDKRVGKDSLVLHGQVALPGKSFTMPADPRAPSRMVGKSWFHPPNRPNDRAVLTPWMSDWGVPGWEYGGGLKGKA